VNPNTDSISLDGKTIHAVPRVYILLHKPVGVVTTRSDELARRTVYDLLPEGTPWVFPAGRLDRETSGLLLLTNDTRLANLLTSPIEHCVKRYRVALDHPLTAQDQAAISAGMILSDGTSLKPVTVEPDGEKAYTFSLREGKNRQIRRMCKALGYEVLALHRTSIGSLTIGALSAGKTRALSRREIIHILSGGEREE
jgi:23S rRNA pseudouridine2605 synthase